MNLVHVWYDPSERDTVRSVINSERPGWKITNIPESEISNLVSVIKLLKAGYDAILVHLCLPFCLAIKMAEVCHRENIPTKIILFSSTTVDPEFLSGFFDGRIHPQYDIAQLTQRIEEIVAEDRSVMERDDELNKKIVSIFNGSSSLRSLYYTISRLRHKDVLTLEDYQLAVSASMKGMGPASRLEGEIDLFISYSTKDTDIASELAGMLQKHGLSYFMDSRSLSSGDEWTESIRHSLIQSKEVLMLLTPNSIKSQWVMIEAGAAWVQGKRIVPCIQFVDKKDLPGPIGRYQVKKIATYKDKEELIQEIKTRLDK